MRKLLGITIAALTFAMTGCAADQVGPTEDPASDGTAARTEGLTIESETESTLKGHYVRGGSVVTFHARLVSPNVELHLSVNGAEYDLVKDVVHSTVNLDGHGNTILGEDAEVLHALEKAFDAAGEPSRIREEMYRAIALMSAAPRGTTLLTRVVRPMTLPSEEQDRGYCDSDNGVTYLCAQNDVSGTCSKTYTGTSTPTGDDPHSMYSNGGITGSDGGTNNLGAYVTGCTSVPTYTHEHEACEWTADKSAEAGQSKYHGRVTWSSRIGWSAKACQGRCGAGCPNSYNFYITKDCLDHDVCLDNHPSASSTSTFGTCGNEFDRAAGDFASGTGRGFTSGCGFSMWGDSTR